MYVIIIIIFAILKLTNVAINVMKIRLRFYFISFIGNTDLANILSSLHSREAITFQYLI